MDTGERWKAILEAVEIHGFFSVAKLAKQLSVSEMTIRRDLTQLEERRQIKRVHGGAAKLTSRSQEPPFAARAAVSVDEKRSIAALAAELVTDGDTIALDVGSTVLELARLLVGKSNLTVVTPNLHIAILFISYPNIRVILPGGNLRTHEGSLVGTFTHNNLKELYVDKFFLGVGGVDVNAGFTEYSPEDAVVKKIMAANAGDVIALVDSSKYGKVCLSKVCSLASVSTVVTSAGMPQELRTVFDGSDIEIIEQDMNNENGGSQK